MAERETGYSWSDPTTHSRCSGHVSDYMIVVLGIDAKHCVPPIAGRGVNVRQPLSCDGQKRKEFTTRGKTEKKGDIDL